MFIRVSKSNFTIVYRCFLDVIIDIVTHHELETCSDADSIGAIVAKIGALRCEIHLYSIILLSNDRVLTRLPVVFKILCCISRKMRHFRQKANQNANQWPEQRGSRVALGILCGGFLLPASSKALQLIKVAFHRIL